MSVKPMASLDEGFMQLALNESLKNRGATAENPSVGCVIVKYDEIIAKAVTANGGRPHAETHALAFAGENARGATVYVTLEPCAHHGKTSPCTEVLIAAGVGRVVTALTDPDPRTAGKGHEALEAAGIEVTTSVLAKEARAILAGFLSRIERGRPHVIVKMAQSADGMIAAAPGNQTQVTGAEAFEYVHQMRAEADAIMVGAATIRADNPSLTCRLKGKGQRSPIRVVVCTNPEGLASASMLITSKDVPVWFLTLKEGTNYIGCTQTSAGQVDLADGLGKLAQRGINRLMVEGGAQLVESLLQLDLVDEIHLLTGIHTLGAGGVKSPLLTIDSGKFLNSATQHLGADLLTTYVRAT